MSGEDDLLERATRALRETPPPTESELAAGKGALLWAQRAAQSKKRRARTLRWVLPLAAVLATGSALAHTTGQLERMAVAVSSLFGRASETEKHARERSKGHVEPAAPALAARTSSNEPAADARADTRTPSAARDSLTPAELAAKEPPSDEAARAESAPPASERARATKRRAPEARAQPLPSEPVEYEREGPADEPMAAAPAPLPSDDLARYREAHRAHFRARDFAAALRAWDGYLSAYPQGTFAIEARYNRAICLLRLGRKDEARRALAPFARGDEGRGYRKAEASKLLEALE